MQAKLIVTQKIVKELMKSEAIRREIKDFKTGANDVFCNILEWQHY